MCFTELPSLWCLWTWTANSKYRMYSTEVQFIYCIFNLFVERSHCETQPSAKQSKAKHTKEQIVLLQIQFNIARIRSILECVLKNNIHWDKHVFWKNSHIVNKPSRNNAWKNGSLFIEMWLFGWVEYILWIKSNKVVSEWTRLTQLGCKQIPCLDCRQRSVFNIKRRWVWKYLKCNWNIVCARRLDTLTYN